MIVSLPKELEEFVRKTAASGEYPSAEAVVVEALREFQGNREDDIEAGSMRSAPDGNCPPELKSILLEAVRGPHHPMPADYFEQLRQRLRVRESGATARAACPAMAKRLQNVAKCLQRFNLRDEAGEIRADETHVRRGNAVMTNVRRDVFVMRKGRGQRRVFGMREIVKPKQAFRSAIHFVAV
jgi:Arc/MetJ-type ribon-helix-helix transcriptional regulator